MATGRIVNTNFWRDTYIIDLDPIQKLLFIYLLTNTNTNLAGVYEISLRQAAFDTGIDKDMVEKILNKFIGDGKMFYQDGWLIVRNFIKHQRPNPSILRGIEKAYNELPEWLQAKLREFSPFYNQMSMDVSVSTQTGNRLPTDTPQLKLNETNIIEPNLTQPGKPAGPNKLAGEAAKTYARGVRADEQQTQKAAAASERKADSGYASAASVAAKLKQRRGAK
jgi:hypothetical protein